jgi:hypothetical protein
VVALPTEPKRIKVTRNSELAHLLEQAATTTLLLEKDGVVYRLHRAEEEEGWAAYDPERVVAAVEQMAGSWADIDVDALIADLYRARAEGSHPADRPDAVSA